MHFWKHESTQFMQYNELNDYMQLKRWIWNDFLNSFELAAKKNTKPKKPQKQQLKKPSFLMKMYSKFWQTVQYTNPNFI